MIIIIICSIVAIILGLLILKNAKLLKEMAENNELNNIVNIFPDNVEICKSILKKLGNESVEIQQDDESKTSLYIAISNKIVIANISDSFARVQTIAHECLHSIQDRKLLLFNFVYSNVYIIYFLAICILTIFGIIKNSMLHIQILTIAGLIYYAVRSYLETDAMTRARYVAKEYISENNLCNKEELDKLINQYDELNKIGIPLYNYGLLFNVMIKILIYCIIFVI